jgi:Fe-S-cluster-containing hydrogenase component 2
MDGVTVRVSERCAGCGTCADGVCFVDAIHLEDHPKVTGLCRAVIGDACRGCGRCLDVCPQGAIEMAVEHSQFVAEAIARISPLVDVG